MLVAADESLYINKSLSIRYWVPDIIKKDASLIREELIQNKAKLPDLSESEIEEGLRFVLKGYEGIIAVLWKKAVENVLCSDIFKNKDKGNRTEFSYNDKDLLTGVKDAMGNRTEYGYDKAGRPATVYRHEGSRELLLCIEDEERKHSLKEISKTKEKYGRQMSESLKEANVSRITRYKRNLMGDVECITNAFGEEEYFSYDLLGRVILKKDMDGYETRYSYTKAGDIKTVLYADGYKAEYEYDSLGKLTKVKDALGVISIENDKLARTTKVIDHDSKEVRYSYGKFGERLKTIYPDKKSIEYGYDEDLRLVSLISGDKEIRYSYDKEGRLIRKDMPDEISSLYSYDERGLLSSLCHMKGDKKLEEYIYGYDLLGNKTKVVRQRDVDHKGIKEDKNKEKIVHKLWEDSSTFYYEYDSLSRLVAVKRGEKEVCTYTYDAFGNRSKMKKDGIEVAYTYDALDRLVKINSLHTNESYEYDKRGNLIGVTDRGKKIKAYEYGALGRLGLSYSNLGNARSYDYDGMGNRIGCREYKFESKGLGEDRLKSINELDLAKKEPVYEERYVLDRTRPYNNMLQRSMSDRGKEQTQSYAWDFNAVFMEEEEKVYTYLNDELGSTIRLLEKEGTSQTIYGYDEFGKDTYGTQGQVQPFGYTGYRYDAVAETYFAQAREYVAGVGRFGGEDKDAFIRFIVPQTINLYTYCISNPLTYTDKTGFESRENSELFDTVKQYFGNKYDIFGLMIGANWMAGVGIDLVEKPSMFTKVNGQYGSYMMENPILRGKVGDLVIPMGNKVLPGGSMDVNLEIPHMVIENGENAIGYQFLHGTDETVGGFQIKGKISKSKSGDTIYAMNYTWNDIIDPNNMYATDIEKSNAAKSGNIFTPMDYKVHITWFDRTVIMANNSQKQNMGWLKDWDRGWKNKMSPEYQESYNKSELEQVAIGALRWEDLRNQIYVSYPEYYCNISD